MPAKTSVPAVKRLTKVAFALPDRWWTEALTAVAPGEADTVAQLASGHARTTALPVQVAVRALAALDAQAARRAAAGDTRVAVVSALSAVSPDTQTSAPTGGRPVPAAFRGEFDRVVQSVAKRKSFSVADVLSGLASRTPEEQEQLFAPVVAKVAKGRQFELVAAAASGAVSVSMPVVVDALTHAQGASAAGHGFGWPSQAWGMLDAAQDTDALVRLSAAFVALGIPVPGSPATPAIAVQAASWPTGQRHLVAPAAVAHPLGWDLVGPLVEGAPQQLLAQLLNHTNCDPTVAAALVPRLSPATCSGLNGWAAANLVGAHGDRMSVDQLSAILVSLVAAASYWAADVAVLAGVSPHGPSPEMVEVAIDRLPKSAQRELVDRALPYLAPSAPFSRLHTYGFKHPSRFDAPNSVPLLVLVGRRAGWRVLWDAVDRHPSAAGALAKLLSETFDVGVGGVSLTSSQVRTFFGLLDGFDGTLVELAEVCVSLSDHG
jgi:hypothetical protein